MKNNKYEAYVRVNRIIIKEDGPLKNIDFNLTPVTVIVGDNERGKTRLLNWISKGLFENPLTSKVEKWSTNLNDSFNVQIDVDPFYHHFDGERMKNLLFIKETDLLFKYKNQEELSKHEYWNNEVNELLYGQDHVSNQLQKNFLKTMGVGSNMKTSWLIHLHEKLFNLKNVLEDFIPDVELVNSKLQGLYSLNNSITEVKKVEQEFESQEELYFTIEKVEKAKKYFNLLDKEEQMLDEIRNQEQKIQEQEKIKIALTHKDDMILDVENEIQDLKIEIVQIENKEEQIQTSPIDFIGKTFGESVFEIIVGIAMITLGLVFAYQSMHTSQWTFNKIIALGSFIIGIFYLFTNYLHGMYAQQLISSPIDRPNFSHQLIIDKIKKDLNYKTKELQKKYNTIDILRKETSNLRKDLKTLALQIDLFKEQSRQSYHIHNDISKLEKEIFILYNTNDVHIIYEQMNYWDDLIQQQSPSFEYDKLKNIRYQKDELVDRRNVISNDYESTKSKIVRTVKSWIDELQNIDQKNMIEYFYPEIYQLSINNDLNSYYELIDTVEVLIDQVSKDRYKAEKIVNIYQTIESNSETLLIKTLSSTFFEYLVQNIFGGKYKTFRVENIENNSVTICAETGYGELYSLETLSTSTYAQFWFILRLSLAKTILGQQAGIILLDDPFNTFDAMRKQSFIDILNALVHEGWQVIITVTHDDTFINNFKSLFQSKLTLLDLNKDY